MRVSTDTEDQLNSYNAQIKEYTTQIQRQSGLGICEYVR